MPPKRAAAGRVTPRKKKKKSKAIAADFSHTVHATSLWCTHCFRTTINNEKQAIASAGGPHSAPMAVGCGFTNLVSSRCDQCRERADTCAVPPHMLEGNVDDLNRINTWIRHLCDEALPGDDDPEDDADVYRRLFSLEIRQGLIAARLDFWRSFEQIETMHRQAFGLTGALKTMRAALATYTTLVLQRRQYLLARFPRPQPIPMWGGTVEQRKTAKATYTQQLQIFESRQIIRLQRGDIGYNAWVAAVQTLYHRVVHVCNAEDFDDDVKEESDQLVDDLIQRFPLDLEDL
jgi:hypothetical protein